VITESSQSDGRCRWLRGLRRGSAASGLLGLWVRIRRGHGCLSVAIVVCCQVEVPAAADHSSRGVLPSVVCLSVIVKPR
jgi:hypothetical protein